MNTWTIASNLRICSPCCSAVPSEQARSMLRYSGFARHKDPQLDAAGALADLLVFNLNLTGLDILQKIENQDNTW